MSLSFAPAGDVGQRPTLFVPHAKTRARISGYAVIDRNAIAGTGCRADVGESESHASGRRPIPRGTELAAESCRPGIRNHNALVGKHPILNHQMLTGQRCGYHSNGQRHPSALATNDPGMLVENYPQDGSTSPGRTRVQWKTHVRAPHS